MGEQADNTGAGVAWSSDRTLRIEAPGRVVGLAGAMQERARAGGLSALREIVPGAGTVVVVFDAASPGFDPVAAERHARAALGACPPDVDAPGGLVTIPVCYEPEMAPDLDAVAAHTGLSPGEVIERHTGAEYAVEFLGFSPGFGYLRGLDPALATPRLSQPRVRVPAGSVAIGADRTAVYPLATAGGWRLIGRTPIRLFDASRPEPATLAAGMRVRFSAISRAEFERLSEGAAR